MEISTLGQAPPGADSRRQATGALSSDFDTFLRMLTVQLQNQDPLNPLQSTDFAVQLATFSQVEQQVRGNDLLENLGAQMAVLGMSQLAGWVGLEARVSAPVTVSATSPPLQLAFEARAGADAAELVISNPRGEIVRRAPVDPGARTATWTGEGLAPGEYRIALASRRAGAEIGVDAVDHYAAIREARNVGGAVVLQLASGAEIPASEVQAIRPPGAAP